MRSLVLLLVIAGSASAYEVKTSPTGEPLRWGAEGMRVALALQNGPVDAAAAVVAVRAAFAAWGDIMPGQVPVEIEQVSGAPIPLRSDRVSVVRWVWRGWDDQYEKGALAVTLVTYDDDTGRITDADILLNAEQYRWSVDGDTCDGAYDVGNVVTHEVGHLYGLAHEQEVRTATMFPSTATCETDKRELDPDDAAGFQYLYAELGPAPPGVGCSTGARDHRPAGAWGGVAVLALLVVWRRRR